VLYQAATWNVVLRLIHHGVTDIRFVQEQVGKAWLAYLHVTGRRALSPFMSCTAHMPGMLSSSSAVLATTVIPKAKELMTLCLHGDWLYVAWINNFFLDSSCRSIDEREVLIFGDGEHDLSDFAVHRGENPFRD
jgi:cytosine/adenosine deaminase-related metal-dependent hydrolase